MLKEILDYAYAYFEAQSDEARWGIVLDFAGDFCQGESVLDAAMSVHDLTRNDYMAHRYLSYLLAREADTIRSKLTAMIVQSG